MSKEDLQQVIEDFSEDNLNRFFRRSCDDYAESPEDLSEYDDDRFTEFHKLGEIDFGNTEKLLLSTARVNTELTERSGKKAQYEQAKKILKEAGIYDAGFFIFHDSSGSFRFSLVYGQAEGTKKSWSNFRRFTYLVSSDQTNITFRKRVGECRFTSLEIIKDAFSVEKVTKDFYRQIADWYFWAVKNARFPEAAENEENGRNIAVIRLITRLIFIWFMKERKLISPDLFDKDTAAGLLKSLNQDETTYYKAFLQNLFFATLNTKIEDRKFRFTGSFQGKNTDYMDHGIYRYEEYFKKREEMLAVFKDIPFLNGGLFDCLDWSAKESGTGNEVRFDGFSDKEVGLKVPNYLFFSAEKEADLNKDYGTKNKKYRVQGLLNILSAYNFTIDENDPNDQEVALDPELLGKVFENLLASFNPETATTARKATGSYYTPREIVDYMVTQSLKQYYKTHLDGIEDVDNKLEELLSPITDEPVNPFGEKDSRRVVQLTEALRIVDPAVGSGAFPMGILNKLVSALARVDPDNKLWQEAQLNAVDDVPDPLLKQKLIKQINEQFAEKNSNYGRKLYLIQKCIYGVDIQQVAIEIAKLRFFIALLVDERIDKLKPNWGIEPLPNLDFKLIQGNSLISEFMGINLDAEDSDAPAKLMKDETDELISRYQDRKSEYQYEPERNKKEALKNEIETLIELIFESKLKSQQAEYYTKLNNIERKYATIPDVDQRNGAIKKDTEILNKNYKFDLAQAEEQLKEFTTGLKEKPFFAWKLYFAEVFREKGGFDIVIANPPYIFSREKLTEKDKRVYRKHYSLTQFKINLYILFLEKAFHILNTVGCFAFITPNNWLTLSTNSDLRYFLLTKTTDIHIVLNYEKVFENASVDTCIIFFTKTGSANISCSIWTETGININSVHPSEHYLNKTGYILSDLDARDNAKGTRVCERINLQSVLLSDLAEVKNGVQAYTVGEGDPIQTEAMKDNRIYHSNEKKGKNWIKYLDGVDVSRYSIGWSGQYIKYGKNLTRPRMPKLFFGARLLVRQIPGQLPYCIHACYIEEHTINDNNSMIVKINNGNINIKYILGVVNSKLMSYWFAQTFGKLNRKIFPQFKVKELRNFPIKEAPHETQLPIISRVNQILNAKQEGNEVEASILEQEIDQIVYEVYGLTEEEIAVVEGTSNNRL